MKTPLSALFILGVPCWLCSSLTVKTISFEVDQVDTISVGEATELLDVSRKTITNHATAGRFEGAYKDRDHGGQWRIPRAEVERVKREKDHDPREKPGKKPREDTYAPEMVEVLNRQIEDLRADRDAWREQARRSDYLLGTSMERTRELEGRLREIEAPSADQKSEARESPVSSAPAVTPTTTTTAPHKPLQGPMRGLLRRIIGG